MTSPGSSIPRGFSLAQLVSLGRAIVLGRAGQPFSRPLPKRLELALMPAYREPLRRKKQSLSYLCEDLNRKLAKLRDWNDEGEVDEEILDQAVELIAEVSGLDIGTEGCLNKLQYLLGDMQLYLWEDSIEYLQLDDCIAQIQDFLDWGQ